MSAPIRVNVEADDANEDLGRLGEPAPETHAMNNEASRDNEHSSPGPLVVRTLKDPPEIWDLVHETPRAFNPGGAFVAHLTSSKTKLIMLTLAVMFLCGLCFLAVTTLRDSRNRAGAAAQVQDEPGTSQAVPASQASAPVDAQLNTESNTSPRAGDVNNTPPQPTAPQPTYSEANPASADQTLTRSVQPTGESVSNFSKPTVSLSGGTDASVNKRVTVASGWRKAGNSPRARRDTETAAPYTSATPQTSQAPPAAGMKNGFEKSSSDSAAAKKRSDKTLTPPLAAPPSTSPAPNASAPKAKVIQWP
jgi:hypothetical protein